MINALRNVLPITLRIKRTLDVYLVCLTVLIVRLSSTDQITPPPTVINVSMVIFSSRRMRVLVKTALACLCVLLSTIPMRCRQLVMNVQSVVKCVRTQLNVCPVLNRQFWWRGRLWMKNSSVNVCSNVLKCISLTCRSESVHCAWKTV